METGDDVTEFEKQSGSLIEEETQTWEAPKYKVVLYNDEDHTYDYVVEVLTKTCQMGRAQAFRCTVEVDLSGRATVFMGGKKACKDVCDKILNYGPDHRLMRSLGSMQAAVESRT